MTIPPGRYFVIGKKRFMEGGITKMLMGEYPKNPVIVKSGKVVKLAPFSLFNMGEDKALNIEGSGITGSATKDAGDITGAYIYVYPESTPDLFGPSYAVSQEVEKDGTFKINLLPGKYRIGIRQRGNMTKLGILNLGDYALEYEGNPVTVKQDEYNDLGELKLHLVDEKKLEKVKKDELKVSFRAKITGEIKNEDDEPVQGIYVYAYKDPKMVGKPEAISKKTDEKGRYVLYIPHGGDSSTRYYIGARTNIGGPLEPGEYVGTYNENPEHSLLISVEEQIKDVNITVKEVW